MIGAELAAAARNNAEWCDIMCRLHGQAGVYRDGAWTVPRRSPPFYPDAITLDQTTGVEGVLRGVDTSEGCSVKDSFACLDLTPEGFRILFDARWVYRAVDVALPESPADMSWRPVQDAIGLQAWEAAWNEDHISPGLFRPALLERDDVLVLAGSTGDSIVAGAIVNRSATVTGVSNVFSVTGDREAAWRGVVAALAQQRWSLPMVGYANGDDLEAAQHVGFEPLGSLRVWMKGDSLAPTSGAG